MKGWAIFGPPPARLVSASLKHPKIPALSWEDSHLLIESVVDYAIFMLDTDGLVATWNAGAERIYGYTAAEIVGQHFSKFHAEADVAAGKLDEQLRAAREDGRVEDQGYRIRKDGTHFWGNVVITALRDADGTLRGYGKVTRDLTERRRTEEELKRSEERFRLLVESVRDYAIFMLDPTGHIATWNNGAERINGYKSEEIIGKHFSIFYAPDDVHSGKCEMELRVATETGRFEEEGWRVRKDGTRFWANVVLTAMRDPSGRLIGFGKVTRDLTSRREAEHAARELLREQTARAAAEQSEAQLRHSEERYRQLSQRLQAILEGIADGVMVQDAAGRILFANSAAARSCGFASVEELVQTPAVDVNARFDIRDEHGAPLDRERLPGRIVFQGEQRSASALIFVRNLATASAWWATVRATALVGSDGKPDLAINVWHDVTSVRRREQNERYLSQATATLSASLDYATTLDKVAALLVPGFGDWCSISLLEGDELVTAAVAHVEPNKVAMARELGRKYAPDRNSARGAWNVIRTGQSELYTDIADALLEKVAVDAEHLAVLRSVGMKSAMIVPIRVGERSLGVVSLVAAESGYRYDVEDLHVLEELARRIGTAIANARLFAAQQEAAARAEEASRIKDEFLATVSHELRTPLNAIVGWASLLRERAIDPAVSKGIEVIHRNAQAQVKIIEDILDVSRIITGKLRIDPKPIDLVAVARDAIEVVRPSALAKRITVDLVTPSDTCLLVADAERLQQVVWNLLSNAVKFSDSGGTVRVEIEQRSSRYVVRVRDTGRGIEPSFLPFVFDRFKQADSSTTRRFGGLGLGLALVRHIVELHGGSVSAHSEGLGKGACFEIELPVRAVAPPPSEPATSEHEAPSVRRVAESLVGLRVLVVDDEPDARELLRTVLSNAGAQVKVAGSAVAAVDEYRDFRPHVLVSDIGMPDADGYSLLERLRAEFGQEIPSIALTAYTRHEDKTKALAAGFTTHIGKPVMPDDLLAAVGNLARFSMRPKGG